ncbi:16S rRNA (cytidine(1402)-2'-O)-methyltransferase [Corynebacterium sp. ES2794-CONJ1]|uniref:16S rRNA (cytidine(1402)-2'-O)-methyltransferase n=1 Tax=unclassified Corynebacterium TaxID=2624378 RepID=UPI002166D0D4|nr:MULTISPECIES: 16S rRNA (cytidine(1402)-2'-O)-methyltransferase [unclassified Corynebacterium]MCS4491637.1 16S rRNA (cytidine(1402)-2'-O)-methyltransferase [Corynebacterium sp. ES2715-CONJ3]MCU9519138.1 16S rRNA (cytidine(1402)-2'-O)-methyltransferase [Corynebacterium sp. ES2794-CONJ1]
MTVDLPPLPRGLILAATPLGNIGDASERLRQALSEADYIAAEDTRRTKALAQALGIEVKGKIISNFDHNERSRVATLIELARDGRVVVVTDAGMPIVSDPGFPLVEAAHEQGIPITCFPGPSAVPVALALSGLHVGKFAFDGFAPRKKGARLSWLESLKNEERAVCFFESPHRIVDTLSDALDVLGPQRRVAVVRELTKTFEEVKRGSLLEVLQWAQSGVRGEITCVIEGNLGARDVDIDDIIAEAVERAAAGERLKSVCKDLARTYSLRANDIFESALVARDKVLNHE